MLVTVHLCTIVGIEFKLVEVKTLHLSKYMVAHLDAAIHVAPDRALGIRSAPGSVIEILDGITQLTVHTLVGS